MGNKVNPISFRLGYNRNWGSQWFSNRKYPNILHDDLQIRSILLTELERDKVYISHFFIKRTYKQCHIFIFVFDPKNRKTKLNIPKRAVASIKKVTGIGQPQICLTIYNINQLVKPFTSSQVLFLRKKYANTRFRTIFKDWKDVLSIVHLSVRTRSAFLLSNFIAKQVKWTRRHTALLDWLNGFLEIYVKLGLLRGYKIQIKGRIQGRPRARTICIKKGSVPLQTICTYIEYNFSHAFSSLGVFGIKVWLSYSTRPKFSLPTLPYNFEKVPYKKISI